MLIIDAHTYRTQEQNKADAVRRLVAWVQKAAAAPKVRVPVKPSGAGRAREKRHRSEIKKMRRGESGDWEN